MANTSEVRTTELAMAVKRGVAWTLTGRGLIFFVSMSASVVLARLLEPEDFGVLGIALLFTGLATRFGNIGFGLALIQRREIRDEHVSSLLMVNLLIFLGLAAILILLSPLVGRAFASPLAGRVLAVSALVFLTSPFASVARALLQRNLDFKVPALAEMGNHVASAATSIALAWQGYGVWSLVYGQLCGAVLSTLVLMTRINWRLRFTYNHAAMKDLFSFGVSMFLKRLLIYGTEKIDYFVIAKWLGPTPLGFYEKAFNLMNIAVKELSEKIDPVLFSAFSTLQSDRTRLLAAYNKVIFMLSLVAYPVFLGLGSIAPVLIHVLYGPKWMPTAIPLQIMCIAGIFRLHLKVTSTVINAMGMVTTEVWIRTVGFVLLAIGCWFGSYWDIIGVTAAVTIINAVLALATAFYFCRLTGLTFMDLIRPQGSAIIASVLMYAMVILYQKFSSEIFGVYSISILISSIVIGTISYLFALLIVNPAPILSLCREFIFDFKFTNRKPVQIDASHE